MFGIRGTTQLAHKSEPLNLRNVKYAELYYYASKFFHACLKKLWGYLYIQLQVSHCQKWLNDKLLFIKLTQKPIPFV